MIRRVEEAASVVLADGRSLAYVEYGDSGGAPVINCHGGLTSRLDVRWLDRVAREAEVRLISPDRPGVGRSDRQAERSLPDWPKDVATLADALNVPRFAVLGWSAGGPYAIACAATLTDRVTALGLVASAIPYPQMLGDLHPVDRLCFLLAERAGPVATALCAGLRTCARVLAVGFRAASLVMLDRPSRRVVKGMAAGDYSAPIAEGLRNVSGVLDDYRVLREPWELELRQIFCPVGIWQGDGDGFVPGRWAQWLAAQIPQAELTICTDSGHFLAAEQYLRVFRRLAAER
jgi:pimeloyl-ACP methyl ester carboxylesterase